MALLLISVFLFSVICTAFVQAEIVPIDPDNPSLGYRDTVTGSEASTKEDLQNIISNVNSDDKTDYDLTATSGFFGGITTWFKKWQNIWLEGKDLASIGGMIKYFALILIALLVFSALSYAGFPSNAEGRPIWILQIIIAIIIAIMATFFMTSQELITTLQSYKAMGIALTVFLPIMILGFFTLVVASRGNPIGIYLQKILWLIYSVYLFIRTLALFLITQYLKLEGGNLILIKEKVPGFVAILAGIQDTSQAGADAFYKSILTSNDSATLIILLVVSVAVFLIMVVSNKPVRAWLAKEKVEAEIQARRNVLEESAAYDRLNAEQMRKPK